MTKRKRKKPDESISIIYETAPGKRVLSVSGGWGGQTPDGTLVVAHLYSEFQTPPSISQHPVTGQGVINTRDGDIIRRGEITRELQTTLTMPPEVAMSLGNFLIEKARIAIEARASNYYGDGSDKGEAVGGSD